MYNKVLAEVFDEYKNSRKVNAYKTDYLNIDDAEALELLSFENLSENDTNMIISWFDHMELDTIPNPHNPTENILSEIPMVGNPPKTTIEKIKKYIQEEIAEAERSLQEAKDEERAKQMEDYSQSLDFDEDDDEKK